MCTCCLFLIVQADSETGYFTKMKFTYCGYQYQRWWVTCPGDPGQCIPMRYACNGVDDCPNGEDEKRDWCFKVDSYDSLDAVVSSAYVINM